MNDDAKAILPLNVAIRHLDPERNAEAQLAAAYNLAYALTLFDDDLEPELLEGTLYGLVEARLSVRSRSRKPDNRNLLGFRRKTPPDALMRYLQGRILVLLGRYAEARKSLETAREDLLELRMLREMASASLELAECYLELSGKHRWHRIEALCREVLSVLATSPDSADALAAYRLLQTAAEIRSTQVLRRQLDVTREAFSPATAGR